MTVKELIKKLEMFNPDKEVVVMSWDDETPVTWCVEDVTIHKTTNENRVTIHIE